MSSIFILCYNRTMHNQTKNNNNQISWPKCVLWDWVGTLCTNNAPLPYSTKLLQLFHDKNIPQCIVSNGLESEISQIAEEFGWNHYFSKIVGIETSTEKDLSLKPAPDMITFAIEELVLTDSNDSIIFIGDSNTDMLAAKQAGVHGIQIQNSLEGVYQRYI